MSNIIRSSKYGITRETVHTARDVIGANPPKFNLKDHPEANGQNCMVISGDLREGTEGVFFIGLALIYPRDVDIFEVPEESRAAYAVTLMTGAQNVVERLMDAKSIGALPITGTLRNEGRAWFFD